MVYVAFVGNIGIDSEEDIGLEGADVSEHRGAEFGDVVEATVAEVEEVDAFGAEEFRARGGLGLADVYQLLGGGACGGVAESVAAVKTDEEVDFLAHGGQAGDGGAASDLDVVGMRAYEEVLREAVEPGKGNGGFE